MTKRQLIDDIRELNPTAQPLFLAQFQDQDLQAYLDRLRAARDNQPHIATWVREKPAMRMVS